MTNPNTWMGQQPLGEIQYVIYNKVRVQNKMYSTWPSFPDGCIGVDDPKWIVGQQGWAVSRRCQTVARL